MYTRSINSAVFIIFNYSRTPLIRINWDGVTPEYTENPDNWNFFATRLHWQFEVRLLLLTYVLYTYLRLNLSSTSDLKFQKPYRCTEPDPITGNFKTSLLYRFLDKIARRAKPIRINTVRISGVLLHLKLS